MEKRPCPLHAHQLCRTPSVRRLQHSRVEQNRGPAARQLGDDDLGIAASTLLAQRPYPDAVFAFNDLLAIGTLQACKRANIRVPEDIAIVGVDNTEFAALPDPPITSIRQHQFHTGEHAVTLLLALIGGGTSTVASAASNESLPVPDLIVRRSSCLRLSSMLSSEDIDELP